MVGGRSQVVEEGVRGREQVTTQQRYAGQTGERQETRDRREGKTKPEE